MAYCTNCGNMISSEHNFCFQCGERIQQEGIISATGKTCSYCNSIIQKSEGAEVCPECQTPHHRECWLKNGGCTVYGCIKAPGSESYRLGNPVERELGQLDNLQRDQTSIFIWALIFVLIMIVVVVTVAVSTEAVTVEVWDAEYDGDFAGVEITNAAAEVTDNKVVYMGILENNSQKEFYGIHIQVKLHRLDNDTIAAISNETMIASLLKPGSKTAFEIEMSKPGFGRYYAVEWISAEW